MECKDNIFYVIINGMDLTGKTKLADEVKKDCKDKTVEVLRSSFSKDNPLNKLAGELRQERKVGVFSSETLKQLFDFAVAEDHVLLRLLKRQAPIVSDEAIGHLYADATAKELEMFKPTTSIIHDSSTIIKSLTIHQYLGSDSCLIKKLEKLMICHPKPTKPEYSILLEASADAKMDRLNKRIKEGGFVSEKDREIFQDSHKVHKQSALMKEITLHTFPGTMVFDTTKMSEREVFDAVRNHLDICEGREM